MDCPVCREALVVVEREGIELDWCLKCRGFWFDEGELVLLAEKAGLRLTAEELGRAPERPPRSERRRCPRCRRWMDPIVVGSTDAVDVDRCPSHGFWLDAGELGRIMAQLDPEREGEKHAIVRFLGETFGNAPKPSRIGEEEHR